MALSLAAGCAEPAGQAKPSPATAVPGTPVGTADKAKCLGFNGLDTLNPVAQVRAGLFRTPGTAPVRIATGTDVDWGLDPYNDRTWQLWLHSLEWLGGAIKEYTRTRDRGALDTAAALARDWIADNDLPQRFGADRRDAIAEGTKFRLATLVCLRKYQGGRWLDEAIARHAEWLARPEHYSGPWNHGTDESMILMTAGCGIGRADLADLGYRRLLDAVLAPPGGASPAIDAEGANNEQSTHYAVYNRSRWRLAFRVIRACGRPVPAELTRRHALLDEFIAFQTTPAGDLLQLGESYAATVSRVGSPGRGPIRYVATKGVQGSRPAHRARVYQAGYVMGRSGWGGRDRAFTDEMSYTARFGPGRYAHGQNDHMALTFHTLGRDILVPSGHIGYSDPAWNTWLRSPEAHNTLVVRGIPFREGVATALTAHRFQRGADTFRFSDTAFTGTVRSRSVLAAADPDALVVLDEARSTAPRRVEQLWHLPAAFTAVPDGSGAVATAGHAGAGDRVSVCFLRIPLPGTVPLPATVVRGSLDPPQGWVVPSARKTIPAPVVSLPAQGSQVRMLTLIVPVRGEARPSVRVRPLPDGGVRVEAALGGGRLIFEAAPDGALRRIP
ncbi:heparinase II/III domain-containing protein [Actinomadura macra]|uniref:heparinase II/III domain-containing protein n=1 Tax=Actinomadura macra TaxID=46164 RepID=UPI00082AE889|nr:heparinase II/III family protein [Actinomadura macra]